MLVIYHSILVLLRIQIKATIIKVGDRPPLPIIITVEVQRRDALPATRGSHVGVRVPEPVVIALVIRLAQLKQRSGPMGDPRGAGPTARQASATKLDALCRKARTLRAATRGDYGDALAARLAAAGARAAQARRRGRPAVTPERLREMMRIVQDQRRAAALVRSPSPRKTPHKFRGSTIYPPPQVPVLTSPGF